MDDGIQPRVTHAQGEVRHRSTISCHSCRRRKVKCDREFPRCQVCEHTAQLCTYPRRTTKPGPKIGSSQWQRRHHQRHQQFYQQSPKPGQQDNLSSTALGPSGSDSRTAAIDNGEKGNHPDRIGSHGEVLPVLLSCRQRPDPDEWSQGRGSSRLNIHALSFILHPTHEVSLPEKEPPLPLTEDACPAREYQPLIQQACHTMGLSRGTLEQMVSIYFKKMAAISLFHEPSFPQKLHNIESPVQLCALLATIVGFAARYYPLETNDVPQSEEHVANPEHFQTMALKFIDEALADCGDDPPPICVVQALIVATHCQLSRGVHGRAWRSLGMCVRLAYELNLHLVDAPRDSREREEDPGKWCDMEEKRRAWWAVWEMDIYASTIRRTPPAVDWAHMEILLPADDADWFLDRPAPSAFLERDPVKRWKALQDSGNGSPKAWYLIISSLMKDAQVISSPRGVPWSQPDQNFRRQQDCRNAPQLGQGEEARQKLEILANAVQCFVLALPPHLEYRNQYLSFDPAVTAPGRMESLQHLHYGIYNIFMLTQLARLMIYRYYLFGSHAQSSSQSGAGHTGLSEGIGEAAARQSSLPGFNDQYFEAADNIFHIVSRSSEDHIRHINPFLPSTIWLAAAVQLVRKYVEAPSPSVSSDLSLTQSRFDVLYMTYKRCTAFWEAKTAMSVNLETLELRLRAQYRHHALEHECEHTSQATHGQTTGIAESATDRPNMARPSHHSHHNRLRPAQYLPGIPVPTGAGSASRNPNQYPDTPQSMDERHSNMPGLGVAAAPAPGPASNNSAVIDFMQPSRIGSNHVSSSSILESDFLSTGHSPTMGGVSGLDDNGDGSAAAAACLEAAAQMGDGDIPYMQPEPGHHLQWPNMDLLPVSIQALLSGMSTY